MNVELIAPDEMSVWDEYVQFQPQATAYHMSGWRKVITTVFGHESYYFVALSGNDVVGVLPTVRLNSLLFGDFLVSMPYVNYGGVIADSAETTAALIDECVSTSARLNVDYAELRHTSQICDLPARTDKVSMHLELPKSDDELWQKLGSKLRAQIKRPLREGAVANVGALEHLDDFYELLSKKYRSLGVPVYPRSWFQAILHEMPQSTSICVVKIAGHPVAAGLVVQFGTTFEVAWAASLRDADRLGANMFLYWSMLKNATECGGRIFDFGRTTPGSGTHRFKKQWGANPVQLYWHYALHGEAEIPLLNLDNPKYQVAASVWRKMPLWLANRIGPILVKNLP